MEPNIEKLLRKILEREREIMLLKKLSIESFASYPRFKGVRETTYADYVQLDEK